MSQSEYQRPTSEQLRIKYAHLLQNTALQNFSCWNEPNTDEPFDPEAVVKRAAENVAEDVRITKKILDDVCQRL